MGVSGVDDVKKGKEEKEMKREEEIRIDSSSKVLFLNLTVAHNAQSYPSLGHGDWGVLVAPLWPASASIWVATYRNGPS